MILDKTGTVTVGASAVTQILPAEGESEERLLTVAAACGFGSLHPVSRAVVAETLARGIVSTPPGDLQERQGLGVVATVNGRRAVLGRRTPLEDLDIDAGPERDGDVSLGRFGSPDWGGCTKCGRPRRGGQLRSNPPIRRQKFARSARFGHSCLSVIFAVPAFC